MENTNYKYKPISRNQAKPFFDRTSFHMIYGHSELDLQKLYGLTKEQIIKLKEKFLKMYEPKEDEIVQYNNEDAEVIMNNGDGSSDIWIDGKAETVDNKELS